MDRPTNTTGQLNNQEVKAVVHNGRGKCEDAELQGSRSRWSESPDQYIRRRKTKIDKSLVIVHAGVRPEFTQDIDIKVSGANEGELIVAVQRLIQQMQINVKFASPADFIPLPSEWEMHAKYVGRYGEVDVFYFDFYSIALSKIERGNSRDIEDVKLLVQQGIITLDELDRAYQEVLAQLGKGRYPRVTPQCFSERYTAIRKLL